MNVTLILGSIRSDRQSHKPALYFRDLLMQAGHQVDYLDPKELGIPLFDDGPEQKESQPVTRLKQSVLGADVIVLVFPEYNHDVSATMRNTLAYLRDRELMHRPVGLIGVSNGQIGGARALYAAKASFPTLGGVMLPTAVQVPLVQDSFPDEYTCTDEKIKKGMDQLIREISAYGPALIQVRSQLG
ncbi:MAG: NAD(P)H-dependent oxidoreductase [bacterium]